MRTIYLDNNATTKPMDEVVEAMRLGCCDHWANASSIHRLGQAARQQLELAREAAAKLIGCREREIVFTSGGTESINLAIRGTIAADNGRSVLVTAKTEHSATRQTAQQFADRGTEVIWLRVDRNGVVDLNHLEEVLRQRGDEIALVSIMWANNETGVVQPVERAGAICSEQGVRFHVDGVQWVGKMPTNLLSMPFDLMSFSAHKFHGPKGAGGLYVKRGVRLTPVSTGGPHERDTRGGTENIPGIMGLGAAARILREWVPTNDRLRIAAMRDRLERGIVEAVGEDVSINSAASERIWNTTNIAFHRLEAEAILLLLSERGVCASAGAACSSGSLDPSPVLLAMGIEPDRAHGSIRLSLSKYTTDDEIDEAIDIIAAVISKLRKSVTVA
jgi:cysteine desulfurase